MELHQDQRWAQLQRGGVSHRRDSRDPLRELTRREGQVLALVAEGLSNRKIAHRLVIAEDTVVNHLNRIYKKLGVSSRTQAVIHVFQNREDGRTSNGLASRKEADERTQE